MSFASSLRDGFLSRRKVLIYFVVLSLLYGLYIWGLSSNPPGSYLDESAGAYNAYLIATTGKSEAGVFLPLYLQFYTETFVEFSNSPHIYLMALMYLVVPPSVLSARVMGATSVFVATLLLGTLAARLSGRQAIGWFVALTAMLTPWLFEASRLILEVNIYPLAIALFLVCLYNAHQREKWSLFDSVLLGATLGLLTYAYTIGRLLAPLLALGLLLFAVNRQALINVVRTWVAYAVFLIPFGVYYLSNPDGISKRFKSVTYFAWDRPILQNVSEFFQAYFADISPTFVLYVGDPLLRHHVPGMGGFLAAPVVLAVVGIVLVFARHLRDPLWRFYLYGLLVSVVPSALTVQRHHFLRLIVFPIFLLLMTIPAAKWLLGGGRAAPDEDPATGNLFPSKIAGVAIMCLIFGLTLYQGIVFQMQFRDAAMSRGYVFDQAYPQVLEEALAMPSRPIYLEDGFWGPAYVHALWYATIQGIDRSNFVHLALGETPPPGSLVLSSNTACSRCEIVTRHGSYLLYRTTLTEGMVEAPPKPLDTAPTDQDSALVSESRLVPLEAKAPYGLAVDNSGNIYVADSGNSRVLKLAPDGAVISAIGGPADGPAGFGSPTGIAVGPDGSLFVADPARKALTKFRPEGSHDGSWPAPNSPGVGSPVDISIDTDSSLYVSDRERSRIYRLNAQGEQTLSWGGTGSGEGEFDSLFGITTGSGQIFAVDALNDRIQVFDPEGRFLRAWPVTQWSRYIWHRPDIAVDEKTSRAYVSSGWTHEVLVFDLEGNYISSMKPSPPAKLNNPSALQLVRKGNDTFLYVLNTGGDVVDTGPPSIVIFKLSESG